MKVIIKTSTILRIATRLSGSILSLRIELLWVLFFWEEFPPPLVLIPPSGIGTFLQLLLLLILQANKIMFSKKNKPKPLRRCSYFPSFPPDLFFFRTIPELVPLGFWCSWTCYWTYFRANLFSFIAVPSFPRREQFFCWKFPGSFINSIRGWFTTACGSVLSLYPSLHDADPRRNCSLFLSS